MDTLYGKPLSSDEYLKQINDYLLSVQRRFFKLELLDSYDVTSERDMLEIFRKERKIGSDILSKHLGHHYDRVNQLKSRGVEFVRVHVVTLPLSNYLRFEIESYKLSQQAGERIYFIPRCTFESIPKPRSIEIRDLIIIDDSVVFLTNYEDLGNHIGGGFVGGVRIDETDAIRKYVDLERLVLDAAIPMETFLKTLS